MRQSTRIAVNRIVSSAAGGLAVLLTTIAGALNPENARELDLARQLDATTYGAGRLLDEARSQLAAKNYEEAGAARTR